MNVTWNTMDFLIAIVSFIKKNKLKLLIKMKIQLVLVMIMEQLMIYVETLENALAKTILQEKNVMNVSKNTLDFPIVKVKMNLLIQKF